MKVLWVNNIAIPKIAKAIGDDSVPVGGWMVKLADMVSALDEVDLTILFPYKENVSGNVEKIKYYGFEFNESKTGFEDFHGYDSYIKKIIMSIAPDVIQIFGTEFTHSYMITKICEECGLLDKVVVSIQGLSSIYAHHYTAFLDNKIVNGYTLRDLFKGNIKKGQKSFYKRGKYEVATLKMVHNVIGRTDWDRATTWKINPQVHYFKNDEMLRDAFYKHNWNLNTCQRHSIFFSQATYPIKGLHLMLKAIAQLKVFYPDIHLYIAGKNYKTKSKYKLSYYEKYILNYIKKHDLENYVEFTGFLDEAAMCNQYLKAHVFVSASSIENSPNSVCEAMILGVPTVSSMVGGVQNLMEHGKEGFYYQADAPYMLAYYINNVFSDDKLANNISASAIKRAKSRHDAKKIVTELISIYKEILAVNEIGEE